MTEVRPQSSSLEPSDIIYILFRRKWLILALALVGVCAAVAVKLLSKPVYVSSAKLLVRYIVDQKPLNPIEDGSEVKSPGGRGETIVQTEVEILSSRDLAARVVDEPTIGAERLLEAYGGGNNQVAAVNLVRSGTQVGTTGRGSNVILVLFRHRDPEVAQDVLAKLVSNYFKYHQEIHRETGKFGDYLKVEVSKLQGELQRTEESLLKLKREDGIISMVGSREALASQAQAIQQSIHTAEFELAERETRIREMGGNPDDVSSASAPSGDKGSNLGPTPEQISDFQAIQELLGELRKQRVSLLSVFTPESQAVKRVDRQIREAESSRAALVEKVPYLSTGVALQKDSEETVPALSLAGEKSNLAIAKRRIEFLKQQLQSLQEQAIRLDEIETEVMQLQRRKESIESKLRYFIQRMDSLEIDKAIDDESRIANIGEIQKASPAAPAESKTTKFMAGAVFGALALGIALAFLLELILDQRVKRISDVKRRLDLEVFLAIPQVENKKPRALKGAAAKERKALPAPKARRADKKKAKKSSKNGAAEEPIAEPATDVVTSGESVEHEAAASGRNGATSEQENGSASDSTDWLTDANKARLLEDHPDSIHENGSDVGWLSDPKLRSFHEALGDRVAISLSGMDHRPKVIGLTGIDRGSGVSSIAGGLARAMSRDVDHGVLLIQADYDFVGAYAFHHGHPVRNGSPAIEGDTKSQSVHENLNMLTERNGEPVKSLTRVFRDLMPLLQASEYDYVIFDLPPVSPTSGGVLRLAGLMDEVLLVVEAEKDKKDDVRAARELLGKTNPHVFGVLNKSRKVVPRWAGGSAA